MQSDQDIKGKKEPERPGTELSLKDQYNLNDLRFLTDHPLITSLDLGNCYEVSDLRPLAGLTHLTHLYLYGCGRKIRAGRLLALSRFSQLTIYR